MRQALVKVEWIDPNSGGRATLPNGSGDYLGVTRIENTEADGWSVRLSWLDKESETLTWYGLASFLVEKGPIDRLLVGTSFPLLEGRKTVANALVVSSATVVERIVKLATAA